MALEYGFSQQLEMSAGYATSCEVTDVLMAQIPGALNVTKAATENDRQGVDWWVEMAGCRHLAVDAKVRSEDYAAKTGEDDLALETWSVVENKKIGWTRDASKACDYILWLWQDTKRFCLVPFPMLCGVFCEHWQLWTSQYKTSQQRTRTPNSEWHSECVFVPRRIVWKHIYLKYSGNNIEVHKREHIRPANAGSA